MMKSTCLGVLRQEHNDEEEEGQLTEADQLTAEHTDHVTQEDDSCNADDILPLDHENEVRVEYKESKLMITFLMANHTDICIYLCLSLLMVSACIALVIVVLQIVLPYKYAQTFHTSNCTSISVSIRPGHTCMCGVGCTATYRCLIITVMYYDHTTQVYRNASLYENEATLEKECSFYPQCRHSPSRAEDAVIEYEHDYGSVGRTFPCLYISTKEQHVVIRTRKLSIYHVLHGLLWSAVVLVGSFIGIIVTVKKKGCHLYAEQ